MQIAFRWAFGHNCYYWRLPDDEVLDEQFFRSAFDEYKSKWSGSIPEAFFMLKLAIESAQSLYPGNRYIIMDNSDGRLDEFMSGSEFAKPVEILYKRDFTSPFAFDPPESVWWKWVPQSVGGDVELFVDIDTMFIGKQTVLPEWMDSDSSTLFVRELTASKYSYKLPIVARMDEHINVGLVAAKKNAAFNKVFALSTASIPYSRDDYWSNFFAESECGNLAYHRLKKSDRSIRMADGNVYTWWDGDFISPQMEWCHFVGAERKVAMMAFYSLLMKFVELGNQVKTVDKELLIELTKFGTPRALEASLPIIFSDRVKAFYNNLCILYNVKPAVRPPVDLLDENKCSVIPEDAVFEGVQLHDEVVTAKYHKGEQQYAVQGKLSGELTVTEETTRGRVNSTQSITTKPQ